MTVDNKTKNLGDIFFETLNKAVSRDDVASFFETLVKTMETLIADLKSSTEEKVAQYKDEMVHLMQGHESGMGEMSKQLNMKMEKHIIETRSDARTTMRYFDQKVDGLRAEIPSPTDLTPLQEDFSSRLVDIEKKIPKMPEIPDINSMLDAEITPLKEEIEQLRKELKERPVMRGGGGVSAIGVRQAFKYIAHTEEPVGDIDGVNKAYTVKNDIFWIAGFTLNGEQVAELPNFTYAGRTITFATALPAAYSGKDFEIKYIG